MYFNNSGWQNQRRKRKIVAAFHVFMFKCLCVYVFMCLCVYVYPLSGVSQVLVISFSLFTFHFCLRSQTFHRVGYCCLDRLAYCKHSDQNRRYSGNDKYPPPNFNAISKTLKPFLHDIIGDGAESKIDTNIFRKSFDNSATICDTLAPKTLRSQFP